MSSRITSETHQRKFIGKCLLGEHFYRINLIWVLNKINQNSVGPHGAASNVIKSDICDSNLCILSKHKGLTPKSTLVQQITKWLMHFLAWCIYFRTVVSLCAEPLIMPACCHWNLAVLRSLASHMVQHVLQSQSFLKTHIISHSLWFTLSFSTSQG